MEELELEVSRSDTSRLLDVGDLDRLYVALMKKSRRKKSRRRRKREGRSL